MGHHRKKLILPLFVLLYVIHKNCAYSAEEHFSSDTEINENEFNHLKTIIINETEEQPDYRLPTTVMPLVYDILIYPNLQSEPFSTKGTVKIQAKVMETTSKIVFHVGKLNIDAISLNKSDGKRYTILDIRWGPKTEKLTISLTNSIPKDTIITIAIQYNGILTNKMIDFYKSSYYDGEGNLKWLAATQFHATYARHAFPCFDEPSFKAKFNIKIARTRWQKSLSNTILSYTESIENSSYVWDVYETSQSMSTYLVAFVICEFESVTNEHRNFTVWSRPNAVNQTAYALEIGQKAINYFSELFNENYQLNKMDMVAVPDFAAGAMENWGLITYKESRLLYDPRESSDSAQQNVASVIVHECAHMWFGNLVTPEWWDHLWLSEAFARYYQYFGTAKIEPNWKMEQQFVVEQLQTVFFNDALDSSKPLSRSVQMQQEIASTGDQITYNKGASIVRMMDLSFGSFEFHSGLRYYLKNRKYKSATPEDLWIALDEAINLVTPNFNGTVKSVMENWVKKSGYPVIDVSINGDQVSMMQKRFFIRNQNNASTDLIWSVPLTWTTRSKRNFQSTKAKYWFNDRNVKINITRKTDDWIIFNVQQSGFYRVNYDKDSWYRIINTLNTENFYEIDEINRAAIVDDLLNLGRGGFLNYTIALDGLQYIINETHYLPFKSAIRGLHYLNSRFAGGDNENLLTNFTMKLISRIYKKLGFEDRENDDRLTILLRAELNNLACKLDDDFCIENAKAYFTAWTKDKSILIPKNQRPAIYCSAIKHGTYDDWITLHNKYINSNCATEQLVILNALACTRNKTTLEMYLLQAISEYKEAFIREHDSTTVFHAVSSSSLLGAEYIMDFVGEYYLKMEKYYANNNTIADILSTASQYYSTVKLINKYENFIKKHSTTLASIRESLEKSLELVRFEYDWYNKYSMTIANWIDAFNPAEVVTTTPEHVTDAVTDDFDHITTPQTPQDDNDYRLPPSIVPRHYAIKITPFITPGNFTFDGSIRITAEVVQSTDRVIFHVDDMQLNAIVLSINGTHLKIKSLIPSTVFQTLTLVLDAPVAPGSQMIMQIEYTGYLNADMKGFYRSSYINANNETIWLAATHLEPVGARRMFPCFDEPALKATFQLSVSREKDYEAISNTPVKETVADGDRMLDTFEVTPVMSTYLLALVVSDFESVSSRLIYSIYARPNAVGQAKYSASVMPAIVKFFETSLGHSYQLSKLDMVALPDFSSGAMENWGLITYRETNVLYDENYSPITSKQAIINVIAHEIAHQWFGNLVSPHWWKYLWLSEGFARYFQYHATDKIETNWGLSSQFVVDHLQTTFTVDSLLSTHPMTQDVNTPSEIRGIFDTISYGKGASVLRMFEKTFGSKLFYDSLHDYLDARQYKSATPDHLYAAFAAQLNKTRVKLEIPVETIMESWSNQAGYPVVNVKINNGTAVVSQERFLLKNPEQIPINQTWIIPITWTSEDNPDFTTTVPKFWLSSPSTSVSLSNQSDRWVIFNVQQAGYYRVNYDEASWMNIIKTLKTPNFTQIHELNRASVIDDLLNLARADKVDYSTALLASEYLKQETNYIPWRAALNALSYLKQRFAGRDIFELWKIHLTTILTPIYNKLGFFEEPSDTHYDKLLRRYVINWACELRIKDCINNTINAFSDWRLDNNKPVPVNLRNTIYCNAIKYGITEDWNFLWDKYHSVTVAAEQLVIISGLACSQNVELLDRLLIAAITEDSPIKLQDSLIVFSSVYNSGHFGAQFVLSFVERNIDKMYTYYRSYSSIESILSGISSQLSTKELVSKFEKFLNDNSEKLSTIEESLRLRLSQARDELKWYDTHTPRIFEWLDTTYDILDYRLPRSIKPIQYNISLTPYFEERNFTFNGEVRIHMRVYEDTSVLVLHTNQLTIDKVEVYINSVSSLNYYRTSWNKVTHKFKIYLVTTVAAGSALDVNIKYSGVLSNNMEGFYRSSYVDEQGNKRWLASTQFQKLGARQAFPCFDEPGLKAKYRINIERPHGYHTLSNMPLLHSVPSQTPNRSWDVYNESIVMSSYLVAFVISDFASIMNEYTNFSVWARPNAVLDASYALKVGQESLQFLENYTGIGYPIEKMDLVAVPDFSGGAMENWGLVTFREYGLLSDNATAASRLLYLNTIIAHELTHMWFGNLVTCDWWEEIWLNEGFAQYFEYRVVDALEPNWKIMDQFVVYELQKALLADSSSKMRPMNNKMETPYDEGENYGAIAYGKSASVIHTMRNAFGEEIFAGGLRYYLESNKYDSVKPEKLWAALQTSADQHRGLINVDKPVATLMNSWASQAGYPVIHASLHEGLLIVQQKRFLLPQENTTNDSIWWIPVTIQTNSLGEINNGRPVFWFGERNHSFEISDEKEWFLLNVRQSGFYRVNYEPSNWLLLFSALNSQNYGGVHEINRAQIIDDSFNLARAKELNYSIALLSTQYLRNETNHLPWKAFFSSVAFLRERLDGQESGEVLKNYVLDLIEVIYKRVGFGEMRDESFMDKLNRELILTWACKYDYIDCAYKAINLFNEWRNSSKLIPPDAKTAVYCTTMRWGGYRDWKFLWNKYLNANMESEKVTILGALGCTRDARALNEYLKIASSNNGVVRDQNIYRIYSSVYSTDIYGVNFTLNYVINNYNEIANSYGGWSTVKNLFADVAARFSTIEQIDVLEEFINAKSVELEDILDSLHSSLNTAKNNFNWFTENEMDIKASLNNLPEPAIPEETKDSNNEAEDSAVKWIIIALVAILGVIVTLIALCLCIRRRRSS